MVNAALARPMGLVLQHWRIENLAHSRCGECPRYAPAMNPLYEQMKTSVFERMSALAAQHNAVNLGQGFPDFGWPPQILEAAARRSGRRLQPICAVTRLPWRCAKPWRRITTAISDKKLDADHVCVTSGATEALGSAILAAIEPRDEVIILTPAYDSYAPMIRRAGATPVEVALRPPEWRIGREAIEQAITPKTRAILFNNPHNPAGRLFRS